MNVHKNEEIKKTSQSNFRDLERSKFREKNVKFDIVL